MKTIKESKTKVEYTDGEINQKLTSLTVGEVFDLQLGNHLGTAGRYEASAADLEFALGRNLVSRDTPFDSVTQDRIEIGRLQSHWGTLKLVNRDTIAAMGQEWLNLSEIPYSSLQFSMNKLSEKLSNPNFDVSNMRDEIILSNGDDSDIGTDALGRIDTKEYYTINESGTVVPRNGSNIINIESKNGMVIVHLKLPDGRRLKIQTTQEVPE